MPAAAMARITGATLMKLGRAPTMWTTGWLAGREQEQGSGHPREDATPAPTDRAGDHRRDRGPRTATGRRGPGRGLVERERDPEERLDPSSHAADRRGGHGTLATTARAWPAASRR